MDRMSVSGHAVSASYSCEWCGSESDLTADHILPISKGGAHDIGNIQILCRMCNARKGARYGHLPPDEDQRLNNEPKVYMAAKVPESLAKAIDAHIEARRQAGHYCDKSMVMRMALRWWLDQVYST